MVLDGFFQADFSHDLVRFVNAENSKRATTKVASLCILVNLMSRSPVSFAVARRAPRFFFQKNVTGSHRVLLTGGGWGGGGGEGESSSNINNRGPGPEAWPMVSFNSHFILQPC